ncbi:hypothetical protein Tco_0734661 [Tanacetum coccineum]
MPSWKLVFKATEADATPVTPSNDGTPQQQQPREEVHKIFPTVSEDIQKWITTEAEVVHIIFTGIDNDIYSIQHQNEVNEIRAERLARTANPLALVSQQQPVYHPQPNPTHYTQSSSTRSQASTRNRSKAIANSPPPTYDQEPEVVADDEAS